MIKNGLRHLHDRSIRIMSNSKIQNHKRSCKMYLGILSFYLIVTILAFFCRCVQYMSKIDKVPMFPKIKVFQYGFGFLPIGQLKRITLYIFLVAKTLFPKWMSPKSLHCYCKHVLPCHYYLFIYRIWQDPPVIEV